MLTEDKEGLRVFDLRAILERTEGTTQRQWSGTRVLADAVELVEGRSEGVLHVLQVFL